MNKTDALIDRLTASGKEIRLYTDTDGRPVAQLMHEKHGYVCVDRLERGETCSEALRKLEDK